jgi:hypothetical protein
MVLKNLAKNRQWGLACANPYVYNCEYYGAALRWLGMAV